MERSINEMPESQRSDKPDTEVSAMRQKLRETYPQIADFIELVELHFGKVTGKVKKK